MKEVVHSLSHFPRFIDQLKYFEMLWKEGRLDRYIAYCLTGTAFETRKNDFEIQLGSLYKDRWNEMISFCKRLDPLLPVLRLTWDAGKYLHGGHGAKPESEFELSTLTNILADNLFHGYFKMLLRVHSIADALSGWLEGCPCHGDELVMARRYRKRLKVGDVPDGSLECPMKGKNLVGLVNGRLQTFFDEFGDLALINLTADICVYLTPDQWDTVSIDLNRAKTAMRVGLDVKFDWTRRLPWCLAGLGCPGDDDARRHGQQAVGLYDAQAADLQMLHHDVTKTFLDKAGPLRALLDRFLAGEALSALPALEKAVAQFMFMPVVERYIEAGHAAIKKKTLGRQWKGRSAVVISMARRLPDLLSHIKKHPDMLHDIALCFARARRRRDLPALLHVESHPEVLRILSTKPLNQHKLEVCLKRILYRTDPAGMLLDVPRARQQNEAAKRRRMKADRAALHQKHEPVTASTVILHAFLQHFEVVAQSDAKAVFTMPVPGDCPLVLHDVAGLMQPHRNSSQVPAPAQLDADAAEEDHALAPVAHGVPQVRPGIFFKVAKAKPAAWHTVPVSAAAASKLGKLDMAISIHSGARVSDEVISVSVEPANPRCPIAILRNFAGLSLDNLRQSCLRWKPAAAQHYSIPSFTSSLITQGQAEDVLTSLVRSGAFPCTAGAEAADGPGSTLVLEELRDSGYTRRVVQQDGMSKWVLTQEAMQTVKLQDFQALLGLGELAALRA